MIWKFTYTDDGEEDGKITVTRVRMMGNSSVNLRVCCYFLCVSMLYTVAKHFVTTIILSAMSNLYTHRFYRCMYTECTRERERGQEGKRQRGIERSKERWRWRKYRSEMEMEEEREREWVNKLCFIKLFDRENMKFPDPNTHKRFTHR